MERKTTIFSTGVQLLTTTIYVNFISRFAYRRRIDTLVSLVTDYEEACTQG